MQSSQRLYKLNKIIETKIIKRGLIYKNKLNLYLTSENIPILWKKHYSKISFSYDVYYKHNQDCRERYFHDFTSCNGRF